MAKAVILAAGPNTLGGTFMVYSRAQTSRHTEDGMMIIRHAIEDIGVRDKKRIRELSKDIFDTCFYAMATSTEALASVLENVLWRHEEFLDVDARRLSEALHSRAVSEAGKHFLLEFPECLATAQKLAIAPSTGFKWLSDPLRITEHPRHSQSEPSTSDPVAALATKADIQALSDKLDRIAAVIEAQTDSSLEQRIEARVNTALDGDWQDIEDRLVEDNIALRKWFLDNVKCLTSADIHRMADGPAGNTSEPASRWRREGRIFGVKVRGRYLYPEFQFEHGTPKPAIKEILATLPEDMSEWDRALWFASANGWLDGPAPMDRIDTDKEKVVEAAQHEGEHAIG